jgi:hypothetical protein
MESAISGNRVEAGLLEKFQGGCDLARPISSSARIACLNLQGKTFIQTKTHLRGLCRGRLLEARRAMDV